MNRNPFNSSRQPVVDQERVSTRLKWFNGTKGFGFVSLADTGEDVFLHGSALNGFEPEAMEEGATLICDIGPGQKGPQVVRVHEVDLSTAEPAPRRQDRGRPPMRDRDDRRGGGGFGGGGGYGGGGGGQTATTSGQVKFFNAQKGFGFVSRDDGGPDAFLHVSVLQRARLGTPVDGQPVQVTVREGDRGWQVERIDFL
jgi:CspA family cold shock protein